MARPSPLEKIAIARELVRSKAREWLEFDSILARHLAAWAGITLGFVIGTAGGKLKALALLTRIHRSAASRFASHVVERRLKALHGLKRSRTSAVSLYRRWVQRAPRTPATDRFFRDPPRLLGSRVIVLKSPRPGERGVVLLDYNFTFPLFARLFDFEAVARRYHLVLEPGWSGYCTPDITCYTLLESPVFVQAYEPRDAEFLRSLHSNLISVPLSANWWVDHRVLRPLPGVVKDAEIIVVAAWAKYKRHDRIFEALSRLRKTGQRPRAILIGYPADRTAEEIARLAAYYGVRDQVEIHERIPLDQVNYHLNRSKINLLWSRREGVNRAIIEGMFAGVPCVVREGFNYGYHYPYINSVTGCYSSEDGLPETLLRMIEDHGRFEPRDWVMAHMTCQRSTAILGEAIRNVATAAGERWTEDLAIKTAGLDGLRYWDAEDARKFKSDYEFLRASIRDEHAPRI